MKTIYKYQIDLQNLDKIFEVPLDRFLTAQLQYGSIMVWAAIDTNLPKQKIKFDVYGTGDPQADTTGKNYLGTVQCLSGNIVLHVFWSYAEFKREYTNIFGKELKDTEEKTYF